MVIYGKGICIEASFCDGKYVSGHIVIDIPEHTYKWLTESGEDGIIPERDIPGKRLIVVDEAGYQHITDLSSEWNEDAIYKLVSDTMMLKTENEEIKKELYHTAKDLHDMRKHAMDLEQKVSKLEKTLKDLGYQPIYLDR